jgi:D-lactate dehydrogenase
MRIAMFGLRADEATCLDAIEGTLGCEVVRYAEQPSPENAGLVAGCEGVSILGLAPIGEALLDAWAKRGVRFLSTRSIGYDHIDLAGAAKVGIRVCNVRYAPDGVADFAVMMILLCLRNYKAALWRGQVNDFSLFGLEGRELRSLTVGVMGTGRIGRTVLRDLSGFGCRLVAYDVRRDEEVAGLAEYLPLDEFYRECDVISLHMPLLESTRHIVDDESIARMRRGVVIVNCARGELASLDSLIKGIEQGRIGALGLDVVEGDEGIAHRDHRVDILSDQKMAYLRQFPNVVMTQHMAFYTHEAVAGMVEGGLRGIIDMSESDRGATELTAGGE